MHDSFRYPQGVTIQDNEAYLPKIGWVSFKKTREIVGELKQTTIIKEGDHWYISFSCEIIAEDPPTLPISEERAVGIDMGLEKFAVFASGPVNKVEEELPAKFLQQRINQLKSYSQILSKKVKGSRNWLKIKRKLNRLHAHIRHAREDQVLLHKNSSDNFAVKARIIADRKLVRINLILTNLRSLRSTILRSFHVRNCSKNFCEGALAHQLSTKIVKNHDVIAVENLKVKSLLENGPRDLNRAIADAGWRQFLRFLKYKTHEQGKHFVEIGEYYPSSQICSCCGNRKKMELSNRIYDCDRCGLSLDRDHNAAIVIKAAGMSVLKPALLVSRC